METEFNSQVATNRSQSERLLALGLKKETADCIHFHTKEKGWEILVLEEGDTAKYVEGFEIPAWSLHRLMCLVFNSGVTCVELHEDDDAYETLIYNIEWRIKEGYFNKEYLEDQKALEEKCKGVLEYLDYIRGEEE